MNTLKRLGILAIILIIAGCVQSLHPLFTKKDLVFRTTLLGSWADKDGKETWTFQKSEPNSYTLLHYQREFGGLKSGEGEPGDTSSFEAHLVQLGQYLFLDLFPGKPRTRVKNDLYNFHLLPVHSFSRVWLNGDSIRLAMLDNDWLKRMLDEDSIEVAHELMDKQIVLTAPTKELQLLVLKYAEDKRAFPDPEELHRLK